MKRPARGRARAWGGIFARGLLGLWIQGLWMGGMWLGVCGCTPALPMPATGPQEGTEPLIVPYPPPAAEVDVVPDPPVRMRSPVWVDGQWLWKGRRWIWDAGQFVEDRADWVYAKPLVVRRSDGVLVWFQGTFRRKSQGDR